MFERVTRPIASLPLIPAIKRVPTATWQVAEPTATRLDDNGGGKPQATEEQVTKPSAMLATNSRFHILESDDDDVDFNTKPLAMVATKRPAQHQPMSNHTNVDATKPPPKKTTTKKATMKKTELVKGQQTLTGYFASMAPPASLTTNSPQKRKWKKYESDFWKKYGSDDDGYVSGASF